MLSESRALDRRRRRRAGLSHRRRLGARDPGAEIEAAQALGERDPGDLRAAAHRPDPPQPRGRGRDRARAHRSGRGRGRGGRDRPSRLARGERYLGFGERSNAVDQRGGVVENYVSDGPFLAEEYPLINLFTPIWGLRDGHPESTYYPVPWLLSTAGYGVLVDDPRTSYFRLRQTPRGVERRGDGGPRGGAGRSGGDDRRTGAFRVLRRPRPGRRAAAGSPRRPDASRSRPRRGCWGRGIRPTTPSPPSWRCCVRPTRRSRSSRPTPTTCRAATRSATRTRRRASPAPTPAGSR